MDTHQSSLIGQLIASELGKLNGSEGRKLIQNIKVLDHPSLGYMAVLDIDVSPNTMWSRVWAVGTPVGIAAVSLDIFERPVALPDFWGDKARTPEEGIISIATGNSIQEVMRRFHKAKPSDRFPAGKIKIMHNMYRALPFIFSEIRTTMKDKGKKAAVIWRPDDRNPINYFMKASQGDPESRDGEDVTVVRIQ